MEWLSLFFLVFFFLLLFELFSGQMTYLEPWKGLKFNPQSTQPGFKQVALGMHANSQLYYYAVLNVPVRPLPFFLVFNFRF